MRHPRELCAPATPGEASRSAGTRAAAVVAGAPAPGVGGTSPGVVCALAARACPSPLWVCSGPCVLCMAGLRKRGLRAASRLWFPFFCGPGGPPGLRAGPLFLESAVVLSPLSPLAPSALALAALPLGCRGGCRRGRASRAPPPRALRWLASARRRPRGPARRAGLRSRGGLGRCRCSPRWRGAALIPLPRPCARRMAGLHTEPLARHRIP